MGKEDYITNPVDKAFQTLNLMTKILNPVRFLKIKF